MNMASVSDVAGKYGVDLSDVKIVLDKSKRGVSGLTSPTQVVKLYPDAFKSEEELARTLAHERYRVDQLRGGMGYPETYDASNIWERTAEQYEDDWWNTHPLNQ
jgi:hypothetical protein